MNKEIPRRSPESKQHRGPFDSLRKHIARGFLALSLATSSCGGPGRVEEQGKANGLGMSPTVEANGRILYEIKPGDTLTDIASRYGVSIQSLQDWNGIKDPNFIRPGERLLILNSKSGSASFPELPQTIDPDAGVHEVFHTVRPGDTLWGISRRYGVPLDILMSANPNIQNPNIITVGQKIIVPQRLKEQGSRTMIFGAYQEPPILKMYRSQVMEHVRWVARHDDHELANLILSIIVVNEQYRKEGYATEGTYGPLGIHESYYDEKCKYPVFNGRPAEDVLHDLGNSVFIALLGGLDEQKLVDMRGVSNPDERQRYLQLLKDTKARLSR